jgi:hypothetical protein
MEAITACSMDDKIGRNWLIRFINSQMLLKGCETQGHLILSAAKAELLSSSHMPVWKDQALLSKNRCPIKKTHPKKFFLQNLKLKKNTKRKFLRNI